jgi:hypothetical protein
MTNRVFPANFSHEFTTVQGHIDPDPGLGGRVEILVKANVVTLLSMSVYRCDAYSVGSYGVSGRTGGVAVEEMHAKRVRRAIRAAKRHEIEYLVWMI